ncbi:MAG: hypothetical protein CMO55_01495 [Verrucomicrobiales bacterium]|nr:hypothetical protein [Verrucomicrobiales bacterium]
MSLYSPALLCAVLATTLFCGMALGEESVTAKVSGLLTRMTDLGDAEKYEDAASVARELLDLAESTWGENHEATIKCNSYLGKYLFYGRKYDEAETYLQRSHQFYESAGSPLEEAEMVARWLGDIYLEKDDFDEAETYYKKAVKLAIAYHGKNGFQTILDLVQMGDFYLDTGRFEEAEAYYRKALELSAPSEENTGEILVAVLHSLGYLRHRAGDYDEAEKFYSAAVETSRTTYGEAEENAVEMADELVFVFLEQEKYEKAEKQITTLLESCLSKHGRESQEAAYCYALLAEVHLRKGDFTKSREFAENTLTITQSNGEKESLPAGIASAVLGSNLVKEYRYREARNYFDPARKIFENELGNAHPRTARLYHSYGSLELALEHGTEARSLLAKALASKLAAYGQGHPQLYLSLSDIGVAFTELGDFEPARTYLEEYYNHCVSVAGVGEVKTIAAAGNLASLYREMGDHTRAREFLEASIEAATKAGNETDPSALILYEDLATLCSNMGEYQKAESLLTISLTGNKTNTDLAPESSIDLLIARANVEADQGKYQKAKELLENAADVAEENFGPDSLHLYSPLLHLSTALGHLGEYASEDRILRRCMALLKENGREKHPDMAAIYSNRAALRSSLGQYAEARALHNKALEIESEVYGPDHPELAGDVYLLGTTLLQLKQYDLADKAFLRAMDLLTDHKIDRELIPLIATGRARAQLQLGDIKEAEKCFLLGVQHARNIHGSEHKRMADALSALGFFYVRKGDLQKAELRYLQALEIYENTLGKEHESVYGMKRELAFLYHLLDRPEYSLALGRMTVKHDAAYWQQMLTYFSERECISARLENNTVNLPGTLADGWLAAEFQIRFKGSVLDALSDRRRAAGMLKDNPEALALSEQLDTLAKQYRAAVLESGLESKQTIQLREQAENLERKIASLLHTEIENSAPCSIGVDEVRKSLPRDAALVEFFRFEEIAKEEPHEFRYSAVLITSDKPPVYIPLAPASVVDTAIDQYRDIINSATSGPLNDTKSLSQFHEVEATLYESIVAPVEKYLAGKKTLILSPGDKLDFLPVSFLRDGEGTMLLSKYNVRYVTTGRDLLAPAAAPASQQPRALLVGNALFHSSANLPDTLLTTSRSADMRGEIEEHIGTSSRGINLPPLPGTQKEVDKIEQQLKTRGFEVVQLNRDGATEAALSETCQQADVVHLATHGFILDQLDIDLESTDESEPAPLAVRHPMFVSGLALTNAQNTFELWSKGQIPDPANDGIVLAAEMAELDLSDASLVVLSACDTGVGLSLGNEGVLGLRQALNAAGAKNIILTLWPVGDEPTVEIMEDFYTRFLAGTPPSQALAEAQKALFPKWEQEYGEINAIAFLAPFLCTSTGPAPATTEPE